LRALRLENDKLRQIVADLLLEKQGAADMRRKR
jgi:hypothetical protein